MALTDGRGEQVARIASQTSVQLPDFDERRFEAEVADLVARVAELSLDTMDTGNVVLQLLSVCGSCGLRPPAELTMVGKALLNLDGIAQRSTPPSCRPTPCAGTPWS